jgi:hypothetical protein
MCKLLARPAMLATIALSLLTPAHAGSELDWLCADRHLPPADYLWRLPDGPVVFYEMAPELLIRSCVNPRDAAKLLEEPHNYGGCTVYEEGFGWVISYRNDLTPEQRACLLRHELAHTVENDQGEYWTHENDPASLPF